MRPWALATLLSLSTSNLLADVTPTERALARELFEQGRKLMDEKRYPQACAKLAESQRLDPAAGTLLNLAVCHEAEGKTATAWAEFNDALTLARNDGRSDRVELATRHLAELKPRLSRLSIVVPIPARIAGLEVRLDGGSVGQPAWGTAVPVDPGKHIVEANAPGHEVWRTEVSLGADADKQLVEVPRLRPVAAEPVPAIAPPTPAPPRDAAPAESPADSRAAGYVVGGLGLAAIGVGGFFGLRAFSLWDERNAHCTSAGCDPTGVEAGDDAKRAATFANIGIGVGAVALAAGAYLVLSSGPGGPKSSVSAAPSRDGRGLWLSYDKSF